MAEGVHPKVIEELIQFLTPETRTELKVKATETIRGLTGSTDGKALFKENREIIDGLLSLKSDPNKDVQKNVFEALVNLTADKLFVDKLLESSNHPSLCVDLLRYAIDVDSVNADLGLKVLNNITHHEPGVNHVSTQIGNIADMSIRQLFDILFDLTYNKNSDLHFLAAVLSNLSQIKENRTVIMAQDNNILKRILSFIKFEGSIVRRRGAAGIVHNCCFDTEFHNWLLSEDVDILPHLLLPLAGPDEFDNEDTEKLPEDLQYLPPDKQREPDPKIRRLFIQSVHQLCALKKGRMFIKEKNTYIIMREFHKWETDEKNNQAIYNLIDILIQDEPPDDMSNLKTIDIPENIVDKFNKEDNKE